MALCGTGDKPLSENSDGQAYRCIYVSFSIIELKWCHMSDMVSQIRMVVQQSI